MVTWWDFGQVRGSAIPVVLPPEHPVPPGEAATLGATVRTDFAVAMVSFAEME
ncbi:MAG: hypothetical protein QHJ73_09515 [Armatimonadota bacterium]|nr:hypothetical protein [Armatimonadota bacterium]